ncbi:restriction endonuclease [Luteimonas mephitis]|uniref:restriction endonuclease n=1 Tax=Luteimonas mephitis TaxID=83615 RepID=UPI000A027C35|nr:restriction endonuclease [Luteimonas mephitis]
MDDPSWKALEKLCYRIQRLVQDAGAKVEWSPKGIKDPDTGQARQVDVLITSADDKRTTVECRDHADSQSVKWIEELAGRKISLNLDGMIAVSRNGFSEPARVKAARFGIMLYDFDCLSDKEIASWGSVARVESDFVQFHHVEIVAVVSNADIGSVASVPTFVHGGRDGFAAVLDALRDSVEEQPNFDLEKQLDPAGYTVDGVGIISLRCAYKGEVVTRSASCTYAAMIDAPGTARQLREIGVQRFDHSIHEVVQHDGRAHVLVDFSRLTPPPNSILHTTRVTFPKETAVDHFELIGDKRLQVPVDQIGLFVVPSGLMLSNAAVA